MRGHGAGIMGMHGSNPRLAECGLGRGAISAWTGDESIMPQTSALLESNHRMPRLSREPGEETAPQELSLCWGGGETGTCLSLSLMVPWPLLCPQLGPRHLWEASGLLPSARPRPRLCTSTPSPVSEGQSRPLGCGGRCRSWRVRSMLVTQK